MTRRRCETCGYDFHPEQGFYLGAMMMGFMLNALLTVPPMIALKVLGASLTAIFVFPFVEFLVVGSLVIFYARIVWLHLEYRISNRLDGEGAR